MVISSLSAIQKPLINKGFLNSSGQFLKNLKNLYFIASFRALPARNLGLIEAGICIFSPVRGLIPSRAARRATRKVPNPLIATS